MAIPHEAYTSFLKVNGYKNYQEAINKLGGSTRFKNAVKESYANESKKTKTVDFVIITKPKEINFSKGYFIYPDGRCFSEKTKRFLKRCSVKGKSQDKKYYLYDLRPYGKCLVSRLVMFFFGQHEYENIQDMPKIVYLDGNPENCSITNLKLVTQSEINIRYNIKVPEYCNIDKGTIKEKDLEKVKAMYYENKSYREIAKTFETSPMAVYRFVKKYIKKNSI